MRRYGITVATNGSYARLYVFLVLFVLLTALIIYWGRSKGKKSPVLWIIALPIAFILSYLLSQAIGFIF